MSYWCWLLESGCILNVYVIKILEMVNKMNGYTCSYLSLKLIIADYTNYTKLYHRLQKTAISSSFRLPFCLAFSDV